MPVSKPDLLAALAWLADAGADEAVRETPADRFAATASQTARIPPTSTPPQPQPQRGEASKSGTPLGGGTARAAFPHLRPAGPGDALTAPALAPNADSIGRAIEIAAGCSSLIELQDALETFDGCTLKMSATKTVFADGTPRHGIMLIGEAPGREEDNAGLPFVGRAGKLLDKMFAAIGLDRRTNLYITNVLNWRPPDNRDPSPDEAASCLPFLRRHIELASPDLIVLLGAVATRHVMGRTDGIMRLRGKWLEYYVNGRMVPVMPTLHPAYLLRRPIDKRLAWRDLQEISAKVNLLELLEVRGERG